MTEFKITYEQVSLRTMIVEATTKEEAMKKFEEFDCLDDYEEHGIKMSVQKMVKLED